MSRTGLTIEQHKAIAGALKRARDELSAHGITVGNAYPKGSGPARSMAAAVKALDDARSRMDSAFSTDCPEAFSPAVYFPGEQAQSGSQGSLIVRRGLILTPSRRDQ